ncbi:MAG: hypothetical protein P3X22_002350 [Thermoprotei archaeon]|nr:hypothetical protein [Thermoprotei archaeon]
MKPSWGTIIVMDLDRFGEYVEARGLSSYSPNEVTGTLSRLVESFISKFNGVLVYGLDWERGTEEAVIEVPQLDAMSTVEDLKAIAKDVASLGASITIVALTGYIIGAKARSRREAYSGSLRSKARRVLERLKRRGGGVVYVDGLIVWSLRDEEKVFNY